MTVPSFLSVSPATITSSGTFGVTLATETANTIFAGPTTGAAAAPTFRAFVSADYPANTINYGSIQNETHTTLLGNPTAATSQAPSEITLGAGLSFTGSVLNTTNSGSVTSVGMTVPSFLSVSPATITSSGTFGVTLATETANTIFAGPTTGAAAAPTFRTLVAADLAGAGVEYGPSAVQNTIAAGTTDLFDVAYAGTPGTTVNGAVINSTSSGTNVSATGLTVTAAGATAGGTVKALVLNSSNGAAATTYDVYGTSGNWSVASAGLATMAGLTMPSPGTEPTITTNTVDMPIGSASYFKISASAADNIDGIAGGVDGRVVILVNTGSTNAITINSDDVSHEATVANEIHLVGGNGNSLILAPDGIMTLIYDGTLAKWRVLSSK